MRFWLPESRAWAASREQWHRTAEANTGVDRQRFSLAQLFAPDLRKLTLIGTILIITANATNGGIFTWAPTFLKQERGLDIASVGWFGIVLAVGQLIGYNICGWLADTLGRRWALALYFCLGILSVVASGLVTNLPLLAGATFLVGFSLGGMFTGLIIFLSELFPMQTRATGMGWCLGIGLFFYALVPLFIGLLEPASSCGFLFATITPVACVIGLITLLFAPETKGRELR